MTDPCITQVLDELNDDLYDDDDHDNYSESLEYEITQQLWDEHENKILNDTSIVYELINQVWDDCDFNDLQ